MRIGTTIALASIICTSAFAEFSNPELDARNLPNAQFNAISAGDFAQCRSEATITTQRTVAAPVICDTSMDASAYQQCNRMNGQRAAQSAQLQDDLLTGCMARKGWVWKD